MKNAISQTKCQLKIASSSNSILNGSMPLIEFFADIIFSDSEIVKNQKISDVVQCSKTKTLEVGKTFSAVVSKNEDGYFLHKIEEM